MPGNTETIRQLKSSFDAGEHVEFDERVSYQQGLPRVGGMRKGFVHTFRRILHGSGVYVRLFLLLAFVYPPSADGYGGIIYFLFALVPGVFCPFFFFLFFLVPRERNYRSSLRVIGTPLLVAQNTGSKGLV